MQPIRHLLPILSVTVLLGACSSTPPEQTYPATGSVAPMTAPSSAGQSAADAARAAAAREAAARAAAAAAAAAAAGPVAERTIYFGFDQYTIGSHDADLLTRHAKYLSAAAPRQIRVEGHTDERGSAEYNLALGQRRADAVRRALSTLGVRESMIESVSWGEQKPQAQGSNEEAWARNRRAEIVYSSQ